MPHQLQIVSYMLSKASVPEHFDKALEWHRVSYTYIAAMVYMGVMNLVLSNLSMMLPMRTRIFSVESTTQERL
jgi:hypothetical protein